MKKDYIEFQDDSYPLAYLITIRCYGTWLHGDERSSVDRSKFNTYGQSKMPTKTGLVAKELSALKSTPVKFNTAARKAIEDSIKEVCKFRDYLLLAINVRSNHVHIAVKTNCKPEIAMSSFKSYATRRLRKENLFVTNEKIWSRHGGTKYLWTENHIESAMDYVLYGQGDDFLLSN
jgi:REP element-mobilizing transposase RayT